jgi:hypothetical protein
MVSIERSQLGLVTVCFTWGVLFSFVWHRKTTQVRRQLVALDDLATHEDMKRRTATALRDFLVSELGSQSGGPTTKEGNKNTRPVGEGEPQDGNAEIVAPHKKRTKS